MNNSFYFNILNIGNNKDVTIVIKNIINKIFNEYENKGIDFSRMCKVYANIISQLLTENRVDNRILNLKDEFDLYEHEVVLCRGIVNDELKYYMIDFTYPQFCGKYPYNNIIKDKKGKIIANNLLSKRYMEVDNNDISTYFSSFSNDLIDFNLDNYFNDLNKKHKKK